MLTLCNRWSSEILIKRKEKQKKCVILANMLVSLSTTLLAEPIQDTGFLIGFSTITCVKKFCPV